MKELFKDLKVLELASVLAGPAAGMFFAELGASVIKIENSKTGGDLTRQWKLPQEDPASPYSAYYASVNYGKQSVLLDLNLSEDREKVYTLVADSDIVISNFRKAEARKFGMAYTDFKKHQSEIIHGNITAYGEDDPSPGFDLVLQAETGFMSMNGTAGSGPLKMPVALIDVLAAHQLKEALLLAIIKRMKTGKGSFVSVSLYETALASLINQASNYLNTGYVPGLSGSLHPNIAPYGEVLITRDGKKIVLAVGNDKQFGALCRVLNLAELASDHLFATNAMRLRNRLALEGKMQEAASLSDSDALLLKIKKEGVPAGIIRSLAEVFASPAAQTMVLVEENEGKAFRVVSSLGFRENPS